MPWKNYIALMPSGSAVDATFLDMVGTNVSHSYTNAPSGSWQLLQLIPVSPVLGNGSGNVLCYFISGSWP